MPMGDKILDEKVNERVPCPGYPSCGVVNGKTMQVIEPDVFGKVNDVHYEKWITKFNK